MTAFFNLGSLILGLCAWLLAYLAIKSGQTSVSYRRSVGSLSVCAVSLLFQFFELNHRAVIGDFSAIADTIRSTVFAACVLIVITALLNIAAVIKASFQ